MADVIQPKPKSTQKTWHFKIVFLFALVAWFFTGSCANKYSTQEYLNANFLTENLSPIDLSSPTDNQQVTTANPTLTWSSRGLPQYTVQISADSAFSSLIVDKTVSATTYTIQDSDLKGISSLSTDTYYWRVKVAQIQNNLQSKTQSFFVVAIPTTNSGYAGVLYVNASSTATVQNGSKIAPYKKIQAAISAADSLRGGYSSVSFDIFVAKGSYSEELNLSAGISIRGGYEAEAWTRNIGSNTTTLTAETDTAIRSGAGVTSSLTSTTIVEGFSITSTGATTGYGIYCNKSSPTISNNFIQGGDGSFAYGIFNNNSSPVITGNTIVGGIALTTGTAYYSIYNQNGSSPIIRNNVLSAGNATSSTGIYTNHSGSAPTIENNTIGGKMNSVNTGVIRMIGGAAPAIRNNIIFAYDATSGCVEEFDGSSNPTVFQNNNMFGCTSNVYRNGGATNLNSVCTDGKPGSGACATGTNVATTTTSGNLSIDNSGPLFTSLNGTDGNIHTMSDNDWHLTTNAINCNVRGGGLDLSTSFTLDRDLVTRTTGDPSGGCTATNTGANGWSLGAYENN